MRMFGSRYYLDDAMQILYNQGPIFPSNLSSAWLRTFLSVKKKLNYLIGKFHNISLPAYLSA